MKGSIFTTSIFLIFLVFSLKTNAQIPFELNNNGHIIIKAKINGVEGKFILDTGAGLNAIFTKFSNKLKMKRPTIFLSGTEQPVKN